MSHRRPDLAYFAESSKHNALAEAYWRQDELGRWAHTVTELQTMFNLRSGVCKIVQQTCSASHAALLCESCGNRAESLTRTEYRRQWDHVDSGPMRLGPRRSILCHRCINDLMNRLLTRHQRDNDEPKSSHATYAENEKAPPPIALTHAFLLYGLMYSVGEAATSNDLAPWSDQQPRLFAHEHDTALAYQRLFESDWLAHKDTKSSSELDWKAKRWIVQPNWRTVDHSHLVAFLDARLCEATPEEWAPVWEWVCRSELRSFFEYCQWRAGFGRGSILSLQAIDFLVGSLDRLTLPQLLAVVWNTFKDLAFNANARRDISSLIPSSFAYLISDYESNGRTLPAWRRNPGTSVARFTSLLWDRLGGEETAASLTRQKWNELLG